MAKHLSLFSYFKVNLKLIAIKFFFKVLFKSVSAELFYFGSLRQLLLPHHYFIRCSLLLDKARQVYAVPHSSRTSVLNGDLNMKSLISLALDDLHQLVLTESYAHWRRQVWCLEPLDFGLLTLYIQFHCCSIIRL